MKRCWSVALCLVLCTLLTMAAHRTHTPSTQGKGGHTMSGIEYDNDNIFAKILDGKIPHYTIFETEHVLAFLDAFPVVPGHALLIPKAKGYPTLMDLPEDVAANVLKELPRLARMVKEATGATGVNIVQNNMKGGGQVVYHVHFHVIPRTDNDDLIQLPDSSKDMIKPEEAKPILEKMQAIM